jgi:thioredoxin reductase/NAD-dependent dihydropyrimidine dehydrogenase PreA subunit
MDYFTYVFYGLPLALVIGWYMRKRVRLERVSAQVRTAAHEAGLIDPASLHPVVDPARCIGCGSCVKACPEQPLHHVLGVVGGRAELVSPTDCIGHGACKSACPTEAITLVFGTARRGVEIPLLSPTFETNVPGIFVAGELGGMGLIRNALEQGKQAIEAIQASRRANDGQADVVIVGAGPAGFAASLSALSRRMRYVTLEQESLGGCVFQYPRGKLVMTAPAQLPIIGSVNFRHTSKEHLLQFWKEAERKSGVKINYQERVERIEPEGDGFIVRTSKSAYRTRSVLLAIGRRGTPRKLGVPGEELPKVVYRLLDPEQYAGQNVLVVGGGDSALEAAASVAELGNTQVVLSYRGDAFARAKARNRERVDTAARSGSLLVLLKSSVKQIASDAVSLEHDGRVMRVRNDAVIVNAGGILPTEFLRSVGIQVETKYGTA